MRSRRVAREREPLGRAALASHQARHRIDEDRLGAQRRREHRRDPDEQIHLATREAIARDQLLEGDEVEVRVRRAARERLEDRGEQRDRHSVRARDAKGACRRRGLEAARAAHEASCLLEPGAELGQERGGEARGREAVRTTHHEWIVEERARTAERVAHGGLGDVEALRRAGGAALLEHRREHVEEVEVDRGEIHGSHDSHEEISLGRHAVSVHHLRMTQPHTNQSRPAPRIDVIHHLTLP